MEILPMLVRLEQALNCTDLAKQMVLLPKARTAPALQSKEVNLVVGYNGSAKSQTALDLTLWIAHQTRLATQTAVTVQVIYVVDKEADQSSRCFTELELASVGIQPHSANKILGINRHVESLEFTSCSEVLAHSTATAIVDLPKSRRSHNSQIQQFEEADRILWQARHLATEWRGSLETHLRFGCIAEELCQISRQVATTALILGCSSVAHPTVQALEHNLPFPVLGIPQLPNY